MSKEREILQKILATNWLDYKLSCEVKELLAQPEPFTPDWANYRQGVEDAKREPLSDEAVRKFADAEYMVCNNAFTMGVRWAEAQHKIGVDK